MAVHGEENDVARVTPAGGVEEFDLKDIEGPTGIAAGPDGKIWVTAIEKVASFSPADPNGSSKVFTVNDAESNSPIVAGPDGQMWFASSEKVVQSFAALGSGRSESGAGRGLEPEGHRRTVGSLIGVADAGKPRIVTLTTGGVVQPDIVIGHKNNLKNRRARRRA